jgi:hypothetical protein
MKKLFFIMLNLVFIANIYAFDLGSIASSMTTSSDTKSNSLVDTVSSSLGVTNTQAVGGITALLSSAASNMSKDDVNSLTTKVPELSSFMGGDSSTSNLLSSIASNATVQEQFSALGLDASMIAKFTPLILNFINSEAGSTLMNIVKSAL